MLSLIRVKDYAIVDEVELEFGPGLSVVTGETGAGKSILVDALGLALGDRADAGAVRDGAERAEISVLFECPEGHPALAWLTELGLDDDTACALRRVIGREGRSRAFINNQVVTLQDLRRLGSMLVDIHGQHAHQSLLKSAHQRELLDAHDGLEPLVDKVAALHRRWREAESALAAAREGMADRDAQLELVRFQTEELAALALSPEEPSALHAERGRLANTDKLAAGLGLAIDALYEAEAGTAHALVAHAQQAVERLIEHDDGLGDAAARLAAVEIELRDIAHALTHYRDRLEADPQRLEYVEARLARIRALARRHGVADEALPGQLEELAARLVKLEDRAGSVEDLERATADARGKYLQAARQLSAARRRAAPALAEAVTAQLPELGMAHGRFRVGIEAKDEDRADGTGLDRIEFEVQLNPGQPFGALAKMASGGELSRIGLALEVVGARASAVPTFVFDEVDAGIGGGVAEIVGRKLSQIAGTHQVMCVTHLPQVASQGREHYRVAKLTDGRTSRTTVVRLTGEERVEELSRMLGGVEITALTRAHAKEMIARAGGSS